MSKSKCALKFKTYRNNRKFQLLGIVVSSTTRFLNSTKLLAWTYSVYARRRTPISTKSPELSILNFLQNSSCVEKQPDFFTWSDLSRDKFHVDSQNSGKIKWVDFAEKFWHAECVSSLWKTIYGQVRTMEREKQMLSKRGKSKRNLCLFQRNCTTLPKNETTKTTVSITAELLKSSISALT